MMELNPYEELGVDRGASEPEIRHAYRKASKLAHPDAGGTEEAFQKVATSLAVLIDPERRKTYDETGRIDGGRPDNDRMAAIQVVERHMAEIVNGFLQTGLDPRKPDPRAMDIPGEIARRIKGEITMAEQGLKGGAKVVEYLRDMAARFELKASVALPAGEQDPIARGFKQQIDQNEQQLATLRKSIEVHRMAIDIVQGYEFRKEPPHEGSPYAWSTGFSMIDLPIFGGGFTDDQLRAAGLR